MTSREIVKKCLTFDNPERMPRDIWILPWAENEFPEQIKKLREEYPSDFGFSPDVYNKSSKRTGDAYAAGQYIDEWGCVFENIHPGIIGEIKEPILKNIDDYESIEPPYEMLPTDPEKARKIVNEACAASDKFILSGCLPRPWERYQFLRGTEESMMDIMVEENAKKLLDIIHQFYMKEVEFWASTDIDAIFIMDDWGAQNQLLIPPPLWRKLFKPLYKDYADLAHQNGKFIFMHSDGNITEIYDDLIEIGIDAINSQIFCMDMEEIAKKAKGKITFWGEIDRQHVLPSPDKQMVIDAVKKVAENLYDPAGGIIAQFEIGPGAIPENAFTILEEWEKICAKYPSKEDNR
ncbi:MAG: methyltransferase [Thermoprotei archaeon]|nr:MAG: methyltransferase [Thermoprotei archaeon]